MEAWKPRPITMDAPQYRMGGTLLLVRTRVGSRPVVKRCRDCRACYDGDPDDGPGGKLNAFQQVKYPEGLHCVAFLKGSDGSPLARTP